MFNNSSSVAPYLNTSFKLTSAFPKRQTFKLPSARRRKRLQDPQKCSLIEDIKPNDPANPFTLYFLRFSAYKLPLMYHLVHQIP